MTKPMTDAQKKAAADKREAKKAKAAQVTADKAAAQNDQPNAAVATGAGAGKDSDEGKTSPAKSAPAPQTDLTAEDSPRISVTTSRGVKSRWRAGVKFGPEPVVIAIDDLSNDQAKALQNDPALVIELLGGS